MTSECANLYLVGFMGTGKTTVGRGVAARLGFEFQDSDHEIERLHGKTVSEIFAQDGEPAFRRFRTDRAFVLVFVVHGRQGVGSGGSRRG